MLLGPPPPGKIVMSNDGWCALSLGAMSHGRQVTPEVSLENPPMHGSVQIYPVEQRMRVPTHQGWDH